MSGEDAVVATSGDSYETHWHAMRAAENVRGVAAVAGISGAPALGTDDPLSAIVDREVELERIGDPSLN